MVATTPQKKPAAKPGRMVKTHHSGYLIRIAFADLPALKAAARKRRVSVQMLIRARALAPWGAADDLPIPTLKNIIHIDPGLLRLVEKTAGTTGQPVESLIERWIAEALDDLGVDVSTVWGSHATYPAGN